MQRLAELEQHQVGGIHDVVDRALAHGLDAAAQPQRRRRDREPFDRLGDVARAALAILDLEIEVVATAPARGEAPGAGRGPAAAECGPHLARQSDHAQAVGPVEGDLDLEHGLRRAQHLVERTPEREAGVAVEEALEVHDPLVVVRQLQLAGRAQHALALLAADLARADDRAAREGRAHRGERHDHPRAHVGRAAHDAQLAGAAVDATEREAVGVGMARDLEHPRHHHPRERAPVGLDALDVEAAPSERLGHPLGCGVELDPLAQPGDRQLHRILRTGSGTACRFRGTAGSRGCRDAPSRCARAPCRRRSR